MTPVIEKDKLTQDFEIAECLSCPSFFYQKDRFCHLNWQQATPSTTTFETLSKENADSGAFKTFNLLLTKNMKRKTRHDYFVWHRLL